MSTKPRPLVIAGNWKMHKTRAEAVTLATEVVGALAGLPDLPVVVLCPPFTSLEAVVAATEGSPVEVGAQNLDYRDQGAYTGEVAPPMLVDLGVRYVIIGHSERRQLFGETNSSVNLKLKAALRHRLNPIVCVGETVDERESHLTDAVVSRQVAAALSELESSSLAPLIIAYEPVWAIGTGKVCEAAEANRVANLIRATIANLYKKRDLADSVPILYGGSVKPSNIDEQLSEGDIDGALVGGASLKSEEFLPLIQSAQRRLRLSLSAASSAEGGRA